MRNLLLAADGGGGSMMLLMMALIFVVMYFFMIRPQQKKAKEGQNFLDNLQSGDKIVTVAGIHGRIKKMNDNGTVDVEIDTNVKVVMEKTGISAEFTKALQNSAGANTAVAKK